ncbi:hypothetical protein [Bacteroides ovatus]|uniref:hypothetical protein n=1 Tax=Bacteroides ovatus TaxID=28116 RepID=UPI00233F1925|nr:hypothetical protein [Bacteroides ovatus]MDC2624569.1 hypothetical protein [Bacteroides ovatus]MDC2637192.1 hypothetical protein [Bacteroides ovatus]MDC2653417.1 hypothetical protein [Bacteroides ovatus]
MKKNPFEELGITIKPKALFQAYSNEANQVGVEKRIEALAKIIYAGYNLKEVADGYLQGKDAATDKARKNEIIDTLNLYSRTILDAIIEKGSCSPKIKNLIKIFYNEENEPKKLQDATNTFAIAIKERFAIRDLLIAYIENTRDYFTLSSAIGIDLNEDISNQLQEKDKKESSQPQWEYVKLYSWFKDVLIPDIRNNNIRYWLPSLQMPATQIANVFVKKYLPIEDHELLKANAELRKERLYEFTEKVIRVLWLNETLFEEPIYLVRCNYTGKSASEIEYLYENNIASICIQDEETEDRDYFNDLINGNNPAYNNKLPYIQRFVSLADLAKEQDVIIIASYLGQNPKIGLIKKGSEMFCKEGDGFNLYCLKMKSVYCTPNWSEEFNSIDLRTYPILKSIIPQQVTISAVNQRKSAIYGIYYGVKYPLDLSLMTDSAIEVMCTEWLRSRFANESYRICYQIIRTGGNYADVDILGANNQNKIIAAQVSNTTDINLVCKKIDKLNSFSSDEKIMFSMVYRPDLKSINGCLNIFIGDVWNEFYLDLYYKVMLERLATL